MSTYHYVPVRSPEDPDRIGFMRVPKADMSPLEIELIDKIAKLGNVLTVVESRRNPEMKELVSQLADEYAKRTAPAVEGKQLHEM